MAEPGDFPPTDVIPYDAVERFLPQHEAFDAWATRGVQVAFSYETEAERAQLEAFFGPEAILWSVGEVLDLQTRHPHLSVLEVGTIPAGSVPQWTELGPLVLRAWQQQSPLHAWLMRHQLTLPLTTLNEPLRLQLWNTLQSLV